MLELDLIFTRFFQEQFVHLPAAEQKIFDELLDEFDPVLFSWIFGDETPTNPQFAQFIRVYLLIHLSPCGRGRRA